MNNIDILNKIIEEEGNCCWSRPTICEICPMSKLKKHADGRWMSCVETIGIQENYTEEEADLLYKAAAVQLLMELEVDIMLGDTTDGSK